MLAQLQGIVAVTEPSAAPGSQNDPMHGVTLKALLSWLVEHFGWQELGQRIPINCFLKDPSINSSLKFLRKTPWARAKVEALYIKAQQQAKSIWNAPSS